MTTYYKMENGKITQATKSQKLAEQLGLEATEKKIQHGYDGQLYFEDELPTPPEPSYAEKRAAAYPSIGDQLDMIYWDKVNGTNLWQEMIANIKAQYPKD